MLERKSNLHHHDRSGHRLDMIISEVTMTSSRFEHKKCLNNLVSSDSVVLVLDVVVCKSGKVFFGAVCNLVIPPLKSGPLEVNKPSIDQLLPWPQNRNGDFQSHPNI